MSHSRSPVEKQATATSEQYQNTGNQATNAAINTENQFAGPVQQSPFYKSLLASGTQATSNAYNNAQANNRAAASASGFNSSQPAEQGSQAEIGGQEAGTLASLPAVATAQATPVTQAAGQELGTIGQGQGQIGEGYFTGGTVPLEQSYQQQQGAMWNALLGLPTDVAKIGGVSTGGGGTIAGDMGF